MSRISLNISYNTEKFKGGKIGAVWETDRNYFLNMKIYILKVENMLFGFNSEKKREEYMHELAEAFGAFSFQMYEIEKINMGCEYGKKREIRRNIGKSA